MGFDEFYLEPNHRMNLFVQQTFRKERLFVAERGVGEWSVAERNAKK